MREARASAIADLQRQLDGCSSERDAAWAPEAELAEALAARTAERAERNSEYGERIEHQVATIDVLKVMSASPDDPQPVIDLIAARARDLCDA